MKATKATKANGKAKANDKAKAPKAGKAKVWQASEGVLAARAAAAKALSKLTDNAKVVSIDLGAFNGKLVKARFAKVRKGMTVAAVLDLTGGPSRYDMACAMGKGRLDVRGK